MINLDELVFDGDDGPSEDAVQYWMERLRTGKAPMPVLMKRPSDRYLVIDGRARVEAAQRLGETEIMAYVVGAMPPEKIAELRRALNLRGIDNRLPE
jgi:hypothetical protein